MDVLRVAEAMEKIGHDVELYLELCRICLEELAGRRERMARFAACGEPEEIFRLAHSWKNSCGAIGAVACAERASRVERTVRAGDAPEARRRLAELEVELSRVEQAVRRLLDDPGAFGLPGRRADPSPGGPA
jgi:HPt (histidine-containing phosphotransfer) domain-containing protein